MNNCESDKVKVWRIIQQSNNELLVEYTNIYNELNSLLIEFLECCDDKNDILDEILNRLDVLIQNLIDCCKKICDGLDIIIDIIIDPVPESEWRWKINFSDRVCSIGDDLDGPEYELEFNDRDCHETEEWPETDTYEVSFDDFICESTDDEGDDYEVSFDDRICQEADEGDMLSGFEVKYEDRGCITEHICDVAGSLIDIVADNVVIESGGEWLDHVCVYVPIVTTTTTVVPKELNALDFERGINRVGGPCTPIIYDAPSTLWFPFSDSDGASLTAIRIESLPEKGILTKGVFGIIIEGDILNYPSDFSAGIFYHVDEDTAPYTDIVGFNVKTDGDWSTNTGTLSFNVSNCGINCGFGLLYNWYAATDSRKISSSDDWVVPNYTQFTTLQTYVGGAASGYKLREVGETYWDANTNGTNELYFNGRANGSRATSGNFDQIRNTAYFWTSTQQSATTARNYRIENSGSDAFVSLFSNGKYFGHGIRLLYTGAGTPTTYTGNDGRVYSVVTIGTQTWLAENLRETKYRNGDIIPEVTDNATWAGLTTGALCAYNNDWSNACMEKPDYY